MTENDANPDLPASNLRQQAEAKFEAAETQSPGRLSPEETQQVLHELQVHQIELEMQNEELRRTQAELEASRARYFDLYDLAPVGYITLSEEGLILEANLTAAKMLGVERSALVSQPLTRFIIPEDQDIYYHHRKQLFETDAAQVCELQMRRTDTTPFRARLEATAAQDTGGARGCRVVISDITARGQTEEMLRIAENRLHRLMETVPLGIGIARKEGGFITTNSALWKMFGYESQDEFAGAPILSRYVNPQERERYIKLAEQGFVKDFQAQFKRKDDTLFWGSINATRVTTETGEFQLVGTFEDITEHKEIEAELAQYRLQLEKIVQDRTAELEAANLQLHQQIASRQQAEEALRKSERKYRGLVEEASDAIFVTSLEGRLLETNPRACEMLGFTQEELLKLSIFDLIDGEDLARVPFRFNQLKAGEIVIVERQLKRKDGTLLQAETSSRMVAGAKLQAIVRDVSDRKRTEAALREKENLTRALLDTFPDTALLVDTNGVVLAANRLVSQRTPGVVDIIGKSMQDLFPPDLVRSRVEKINEVVRTRQPVTFVDHRAGLTLENRFQPVFDAHGNVTRLAVYSLDITERVQIEGRLQESETRYRALVENSPNGITLTDLTGKILQANDKTAGLHGFKSPQGIIGHNTFEFVAPECQERAITNTQRLLRSGGSQTDELALLRQDGSRFIGEITSAILSDADGKPRGLIGVMRDITAYRMAEEALRRANAYNRSLIEAALDPLAAIGPDGKIADVNAATEAVTGYAREELIGTDFCDYFTDPDRARAGFQQVFRDGLVRNYALEIRHRAGQTTPVYYNASVYRDEAGQVVGVLVAAHDLTERQRAEALQQEMEVQMQVLRQMERLRAELIGNVSHELRTPLGVILVMVTALRKEYIHTDSEVRDQFLRDIEEEARNLQGIVDNLLDESRLQSGRLALDRREVDVRALIRKTVEHLAVQAPQHRLCHQLPEVALPAALDVQRIEQVLRNLLDNAVKYSPAGTAIIVQADMEAETLRIAVSDEGPGIPPAERERIFERFYRVVDPSAPPVAGLGLGLSICRGIVEAHGGRLWVEERPGGGSVFVFTLPRGIDYAAPYDRRRAAGDRRKPASGDDD